MQKVQGLDWKKEKSHLQRVRGKLRKICRHRYVLAGIARAILDDQDEYRETTQQLLDRLAENHRPI